jgi:signal transduction histidine kinase
MSSSHVPAEVVHDGVARVAADGRLEAVTAAMRELLTRCGVRTIDELAAIGSAPIGATPVVSALAGGSWELRRVDSGSGSWLVARNVTEREQGLSAALAAARARSLAGAAASIAHDLNNQFGAALGLVAQVRPHLHDEAERELLGRLEAGTKVGSRMVSVLARLLTRDAGPRVPVALQELLDNVLSILRKSVDAHGTRLTVAFAPDVPRITSVATLVEQALVQGLLAVVNHTPKAIAVGLDGVDHAIAGARSRRCAHVGIDVEGIVSGAAASMVAAAGMTSGSTVAGSAVSALRTSQPLHDLVGAALVQRRLGGELRAEHSGTKLRLDFYWPAAVSD